MPYDDDGAWQDNPHGSSEYFEYLAEAGDYDDDWYEGFDHDEVLTPVQKIKRGLHHWSWRLLHRIKWIASKHYRDHYDDIPF